MAFTARDIISDALTTLVDPGAVRWPLPELFGYTSDGLKAIAAAKPNADSRTVTLYLAIGTLQTLPPQYRSISRVTRNMTTGHDEEGGPVGGPAIRPLASTAQLDALIPNWQSAETMRGRLCQHVIYDLADPRRFYVAPANDGTGKVEAVVLAVPTTLTAPASPLVIASYEAVVIPLGDEYRNPLRDYVLARAFSKDSAQPAAMQRAADHLAMFTSQIEILTVGEGGTSLQAKVNKALSRPKAVPDERTP